MTTIRLSGRNGQTRSCSTLVAVIAAVFIVAEISRDGETNWLEGVQLLSVYLILAILFYFLPA